MSDIQQLALPLALKPENCLSFGKGVLIFVTEAAEEIENQRRFSIH